MQLLFEIIFCIQLNSIEFGRKNFTLLFFFQVELKQIKLIDEELYTNKILQRPLYSKWQSSLCYCLDMNLHPAKTSILYWFSDFEYHYATEELETDAMQSI